MKSNALNSNQQSNQKAYPHQKNNNKFIYSKQKFSSPEFFLRSPIDTVNRNLFYDIFSPQPRKNTTPSLSPNVNQKTADNNARLYFSPQIKSLNDKLISKVNNQPQIIVNDSVHLAKANLPKKQHNFQTLQTNANQQNQYEKINYLKHRRNVSEPTDLRTNLNAKKPQNDSKNVRFNEEKIKTNIGTFRKQLRKQIQRSTSPSILKNKNKKRRIVSVDDALRKGHIKTDETGEISSDQVKEDMNERGRKENIQIRKKYDNIVSNLVNKSRPGNTNYNTENGQKRIQEIRNIKESQKFTDLIFPPNDSSLFSYNKLVQIKQGKIPAHNIKWVRIHQLFPEHKLVLYDPLPQKNSQISLTSGLFGCFHLATAMNAIKNCKPLLATIFESQVINELGIYILKIFQQNVWKYIIIDDKIPVIQNPMNSKKNTKKMKHQEENMVAQIIPAFLKIECPKNATHIQIWPILLEKAYASYYSSYETFQFGNSVDYLQELTGIPRVILNFKILSQSHQSLSYLEAEFKNDTALGLGQRQNGQQIVPVFAVFSKAAQKNVLAYCDPQHNFQQISLPYEKIPFQFPHFHLFSLHKYAYLSHCLVGHYKKKNLANSSTKNYRREYSLRYLCLEDESNVMFSIRQKQQRFYQNSSFKYEYIWVRVILVQKQFNGDYRWITGKYSSLKSINFQTYLSPGHYYLIVMPQWKQTHCHQLNLFLYSDIPNLKLAKQSYNPEQRMIEKASMDLAQRKGKLSQVNAFICSYNYLNQDVGMIMENINNQRTLGSVKVMRSINGLKASVDIIPINKEFYQISEKQKKEGKRYKNNITINIGQQSSFTVVLKMKGGIDKKFFQVFDFGN